MKKRAGLLYPLVLLVAIIFMFGLTWAVLYWGGMLPLQNYIIGLYGTSIFPTAQYDFMVEIGVFWGFIATLAVLLWLWNQSNRRDTPTV